MLREPHKLLALGCSHVFCKFPAPEPVSPVFLFHCAAVLQQDKKQLSTAKPLQNSPQGVTGNAGNRGGGRNRTQEADIEYQGHFDEAASCDKGGSMCKRGDFERSGAEESPCSWCWLDLTRKKAQIVVRSPPTEP